MTVLIAPSILNADFAHLADEVAAVAGADWLHVDVMDNHFVPNLTLGLPVVQSLAKVTDLPLDCHLMIEDPNRWAVGYAEAGAHNVTVHAEAVADPIAMAADLHAAGARAGLSLKPGTPLEAWTDVLKHYDTLLVMTIDTESREASIISVPRDTRVRVKGLGWDKINHAYAFGGPGWHYRR